MKLLKLYKGIIHVYNNEKSLMYSFWACGDYKDYVSARCELERWCYEQNKEHGDERYLTSEVVELYGECTNW